MIAGAGPQQENPDAACIPDQPILAASYPFMGCLHPSPQIPEEFPSAVPRRAITVTTAQVICDKGTRAGPFLAPFPHKNERFSSMNGSQIRSAPV